MNDNIYMQFAESLLSIAPDFPMDAAEIEMFVRTKGLRSFTRIADCYDPGLSKVVGLLAALGKGGAPHGKG